MSAVTEPSIQLEASWLKHLRTEFDKPYMRELRLFLRQQKDQRKVIYPRGADMFNAFRHTPLDDVKVVILGQDPYHGPGQAHGLSFSVPQGIALPPSLVNIFKELHDDLGVANGQHGCLEAWASEGVLLLNSVLSVEKSQAASHRGKGWEQFTDRVIEVVNSQCSHVVFMLWGAYAQSKGQLLDSSRHLVLKAPHPSPLSAHRGFFGCQHFSAAAEYLSAHNRGAVNWALPAIELTS